MVITKDFKFSGIYCIINLINNKKYIGSSKNIYQRWNKHRHNLRNNIHANPHLQNSWNKYGEKYFKFIVLEKCSTENLESREQYYINTMNPEFNIVSDIVRHVLPEESKKQISESLKTLYKNGYINARKGVKLSEDTKKRIGMANSKKCLKRQKGVYIYSKDKKQLIYKFNTLKEAADYIGCCYQAISCAILSKSHLCKNYYLTREKLTNE